jgi:hypothetical protein
MGFPVGLPLRVAGEWVRGLEGSERLWALEALTLCDPVGVAKLPKRIQKLADKLHWQYQHGILVIPAWPLRPPNPNVRVAWIAEVDRRIGDTREGQQICRAIAVSWGGSYYPNEQVETVDAHAETVSTDALAVRTPDLLEDPSTSTVRTDSRSEQLIPTQQQLLPVGVGRPRRNFPLPPGARMVHGVKGDYYVLRGKIDYPPSFQEFYITHPRPVEKAEAYGVWLALDPSPEEVDAILTGVRRFAANPYTHAHGRRYVVYPARWLQRRRWDDADVPVPVRTEEEISDHLELRGKSEHGFTPEDYE